MLSKFITNYNSLTDINIFAKHYFEQRLPWGRAEQMDMKWKQFAEENPDFQILFVKYEGQKFLDMSKTEKNTKEVYLIFLLRNLGRQNNFNNKNCRLSGSQVI